MSDAKDDEIQRLRGWLDRVLYKTGCTRGQRTTQWCDEARESHEELREARAEIERLRSRVGWLDHLDTEEGRKAHANEALLVDIERLKAELREAKFDLVEAMELLRAHGQAPSWFLSREEFAAVKDWNRRYGELLLKHKEAT